MLPLEQAINTGCQLHSWCHNQNIIMCLKGAVLNIKFGPFYVVFFTPLSYDHPFDATLVLWQYESRIRGGLLYHHCNLKKIYIYIYLFTKKKYLRNHLYL